MCVCALYLGIADLQCPSVQLFDSGVMGGDQHAVLPPQDGGGGASRGHTAQHHRTVNRHRLIGWTLADHRRWAVRHNCEDKRVHNAEEREEHLLY